MLRSNLLFIHVASAMGIFAALGMEVLALAHLRRATGVSRSFERRHPAMAALHDTLSITIVDGDAPIATADVEPDLDESDDVTGQYEPLVEFRVLRYSLLPDFERVRPRNAIRLSLARRPSDLIAAPRSRAHLRKR